MVKSWFTFQIQNIWFGMSALQFQEKLKIEEMINMASIDLQGMLLTGLHQEQNRFHCRTVH